MTQSDLYCKNKVALSGSSFYYSFLFLPPEQRTAITAIYAFCREVDDIVDDSTNPDIARQQLAWWHEEIQRVFDGNPQHPVGIALKSASHKFKLPKIWFDEILQGMQMDLDFQGYQTFADVKVYCHCVASTVGMLAASVFGYTNPKTLDYAKNLGLAFQLINIVRDIGEDARRGRIYIAEEELQNFGLQADDLLQVSKHDVQKVRPILGKLAQLARNYYAMAIQDLPNEDRQTQRSGLIMAKIYLTILTEIEKSNFAVLHQRISITPLRKLWIAWRTARTEKKLCQAL